MTTPPGRWKTALARLALIGMGAGLALAGVELFLRSKPNLIPLVVRTNPPVRRSTAFDDETYEVRLSDGDLFHWLPDTLQPLTSERDKVVARVHWTTDANGFRNPPRQSDQFSVVAIGDSFTEGAKAANPWPQQLSLVTGLSVLNLGETGSGPLEQLVNLQTHGLETRSKWIVVAYFEGNDLADVAANARATNFLVLRLGKYLLLSALGRLDAHGNPLASPIPSKPSPAVTHYRYPISIRTGDHDLEIAFFPAYVSWLSACRETILASRNFSLLKEAVSKMKALIETTGARFLLVYVPSKEHVYLPRLRELSLTETLIAGAQPVVLDDQNFLTFGTDPLTVSALLACADDQEQLLKELTAEHDIAFLDLTPRFQAIASTGADPYYSFDTHWNQSGHDLAAAAIAEVIRGSGTHTP